MIVNTPAHDARHIIRFQRNTPNASHKPDKFAVPLLIQPVVPRNQPVHTRNLCRHRHFHRRGDQNAAAVTTYCQYRRAAKFHVQIVVITGQVIDIVVIGYQRQIYPSSTKATTEFPHSYLKHQSGPGASCCSTSATQNAEPGTRPASLKS